MLLIELAIQKTQLKVPTQLIGIGIDTMELPKHFE